MSAIEEAKAALLRAEQAHAEAMQDADARLAEAEVEARVHEAKAETPDADVQGDAEPSGVTKNDSAERPPTREEEVPPPPPITQQEFDAHLRDLKIHRHFAEWMTSAVWEQGRCSFPVRTTTKRLLLLLHPDKRKSDAFLAIARRTGLDHGCADELVRVLSGIMEEMRMP